MTPELTILMPVFNERSTVEAAVADALNADLPVESRELILVDDGSTDGTREVLDGLSLPENAKLLRHDRNRGKGAAIRTGLTEATGKWTTILDADLEYEASEIGKLLHPLRHGDADVVYGTRSFQSHSAYSFWYVVGNKFVTFAANLLFNAWISDIMTCHKIVATERLSKLRLRSRGFAIEPEITALLLRQGARLYEVPTVYRARTREEGKKLTSADGFRVLVTLVRGRLLPQKRLSRT
jgi:dolichol-phosphate hexosyltransferase